MRETAKRNYRLGLSGRQFLCSVAFVAMALLATGSTSGADGTGSTASRAALESIPLPLEPLYRVKSADGKQPFVTRNEAAFTKLQVEGVAFLAVSTSEWPAGLVPVFAVENPNRVELRRRPARGQENFSEPIFFALPLEDEPDAGRLAGRWDVRATRGPTGKEYLAWELTIEAEQIVGRFDQNTQYRFASITGGTFRSNRFELRVDYINDAYFLTGEWRDGKLKGQWRHADDVEHGTWEASREIVQLPGSKEVVPLYEWRRTSDDAIRYAMEGERMEPDWERSKRPLCRVWREPVPGRKRSGQ